MVRDSLVDRLRSILDRTVDSVDRLALESAIYHLSKIPQHTETSQQHKDRNKA
jgi:hypothetical protein